MYQFTIEDMELLRKMSEQRDGIAFLAEAGDLTFHFTDKASESSPYFIACCIVVGNPHISTFEDEVKNIIQNCGVVASESNNRTPGMNPELRSKLFAELLNLDFSLIILIADKLKYVQDYPHPDLKESFLQHLYQKLYDDMYRDYPNLKIVINKSGLSEFQQGYREYVYANRAQLSLFDEFDFDIVSSNPGPIGQMADLVAESIMTTLLDAHAPNALKILENKIKTIINFPRKYPSEFESIKENKKFDAKIFNLAEHCATSYIEAHKNAEDDDIQMRIRFLKLLLWKVRNFNSSKYIPSGVIIRHLSQSSGQKINRDYLYRKIIAPLRDAGVIIASCSQGYKIPTCVEDIYAYANQTNSIVGPMLNRVKKCRELILDETDGALDILDHPSLKKYKRFYGD